ncbi:hypothetical protein FQA39_LY08781 [Lamprigera yunnana]|nr:hypothetical protein FQA39_LY08781 [Lamprigera yunnana]
MRRVEAASGTSLRGPTGLGVKLTPENNYDMENRRLTNVMDPANSSDVPTLKYYLSSRNKFGGSRLLEVGTPSSKTDATNKTYVDLTVRDNETSMRTYMNMLDRDGKTAMRTHYTPYFDNTNTEIGKIVDKINDVHYAVERDINGIIGNIIPSVVKTMVLNCFTPQAMNIQREILTKIPNSIKIAVEEFTNERNTIIGNLKAQLYNLNKRIELLEGSNKSLESTSERQKLEAELEILSRKKKLEVEMKRKENEQELLNLEHAIRKTKIHKENAENVVTCSVRSTVEDWLSRQDFQKTLIPHLDDRGNDIDKYQ